MNTGVTRPLDLLGRVVLPAEIRSIMGIKTKDALAIYIDDKNIVLKKYEPGCMFCNNAEQLVQYKGRVICHDCVNNIKNL